MTLEDTLKQAQVWLDNARTSLVSTKTGESGPVEPADLVQQRLADLKARAVELAAQRERTIQRYDAAIADLNSEIARLAAPPDTESATSAAEKPQAPASAQPAAPAMERLQSLAVQPAAPAPKKSSKTRKAAASTAKTKAKK